MLNLEHSKVVLVEKWSGAVVSYVVYSWVYGHYALVLRLLNPHPRRL